MKSLPRHVDGMDICLECVIKKFKAGAPGSLTQQHVSCSDLWALNRAAQLADTFNYVFRPFVPIRFVEGLLYQDSPSILADGASEETGILLLVEPKLDSFVKRNSNTGWVQNKRSAANDVARAFSHWSWSYTDGSCLVCDLQGTTDLLCTDPVIHTTAGRRTLTDLGERGICALFKPHVCNYICQHLERPSAELLTRYTDWMPVEKRTTYWFESVPVSATSHAQQGGTCYDNAAATLIRSHIRLLPDFENGGIHMPKHNELVADIVLEYGVNGQWSAFQSCSQSVLPKTQITCSQDLILRSQGVRTQRLCSRYHLPLDGPPI